VIDLHSHILPGVDDGAATFEESIAIAAAAVSDGIEVLAATPHVRSDFPTAAGTMERLVAELQEELAARAVPLRLQPGGEIALDWIDELGLAELRRFGLGGNPDCVLLEFPYAGWPLGLADRVFSLAAAGLTPVIAHPERSSDVQQAPERLEPLVRSGALVQVTAASLDGRLGRRTQRAALDLVRGGLAHLIASDAHSPAVRGIGMSAAAEAVGDPRLAAWLTREVPAAIVAGEPLPARPATPPRRRRAWWSLRRD
jgi:protein-tyrosine phosphatase